MRIYCPMLLFTNYFPPFYVLYAELVCYLIQMSVVSQTLASFVFFFYEKIQSVMGEYLSNEFFFLPET